MTQGESAGRQHDYRTVPVVQMPFGTTGAAVYQRGEPVIWRGYSLGWPLMHDLAALDVSEQLEYLDRLIGHRTIRYTEVPAIMRGVLGRPGQTAVPYYSTEDTFSAFSVAIRTHLADPSKPSCYAQSNAMTSFPELLDRIDKPSFLTERVVATTRIWIGVGRHVGALHYDLFDNCIFMLAGRKRVHLFPFDVLPFVYPTPPYCGAGGVTSSFVDVLEPDFQRYPNFRKAQPQGMVAELCPGDILFVPANVWHHVESAGLNIMVNLWSYSLDAERMELLSDLFLECVALLAVQTKEVRVAARHLFYSGIGNTNEAAGRGSVLHSDLHSALLVLSNRFLALNLPSQWMHAAGVLYDYYVFQMDGPPAPSLPGQFEQFVQAIDGLKERRLSLE